MDKEVGPASSVAGGPARIMRQASRFIPAPLRRGGEDPVFTGAEMPKTFLGFVWQLTAWDQAWLTLISIGVSVLGTVPIEIQRRIVNDSIKQKNLGVIATLAAIYVGLVLAQGVTKLVLNLYRSWINANSVRLLRTSIRSTTRPARLASEADVAVGEGVEVSMIVAEADAVGGYVGECISEPALEAGILVSVFGYMLILQPILALVSLLSFLPQLVFVPLLQRMINRLIRRRVTKLREAGAEVIADQQGMPGPALDPRERFRQVFLLDMGVNTLKFGLNFLMNLTNHLGTVAILGLGAWMVVAGNTEVGTVVAFLSGLASMTDPWGELINWYQALMVTNAKYGLVRDAMTKLSEEDVSVELAVTVEDL